MNPALDLALKVVTLKEEAERLRLSVGAGFRPVADAVDWADRIIDRESSPPAAVLDVSLAGHASPAEMAALLDAVPGEVARTQVARSVLRDVLTFLDREPARGQDVARWLYNMASLGYLPEEDFGYGPMMLEDRFALAAKRVYGTYADALVELRSYLEEQGHRDREV